MVRPTRWGAMPLRVTSTSGSSGMAESVTDCLVRGIKYTYTASPMAFQFRSLQFALAAALILAGILLGGARAQSALDPDDDDDDDDAPGVTAPAKPAAKPAAKPPAKPAPKLPAHELTGPMLYDFLLGEIAAQRGSAGFAAQTYVDLAKRTRDPRVARRAVEVSNFARMPELAMDAARVWHEADPASLQALQTNVVLLVGAKRVNDTEPYLVKLLAADANAAANVFMQLSRLLAGSADGAANLRLVQRLADRYPKLPQARFA